ncbi:MAG TPA: ferritin-like domain-containing protein [Steroidobacteraceae bacterium]|nr:ferritin-like domain-containing protein [Steroidobacteraceae bacterium]
MSTAAIEIGSRAHRELLARFFMDSYVEFVPEQVQWPALSAESRQRLVSLPFWQEAVATENVTSNTVAAAAALEPDPDLRQAIELQGFEEGRHARLLQALTTHYDIRVDNPPRYQPRDLEHDFLFAGFGECFDSFFAFGLFALARESGYFEPRLVEVFEPVVQEEARHILFFVNWVKYRRSQLPWWRRPGFSLRCGWIILKQVWSRAKTARTLGGGDGPPQPAAAAGALGGDDGENFTLSAHQDLGEDVTLHKLLGLCLRENAARLAPYDARLLRPRLVPTLARFMYRVLPKSL